MGVVVAIGDVLPNATFYVKYNSANNFTVSFWDDEERTQPADLTGTTATIEIDNPTTLTFVTGSAGVAANEINFTISATASTVNWNNIPFRIVLTKLGARNVIAAGKARVQK